MSEAETIAREISQVLKDAVIEQGKGDEPCLADWADDPWWRDLAAIGVCEFWTDRLTPLGIELRSILTEPAPGGGS